VKPTRRLWFAWLALGAAGAASAQPAPLRLCYDQAPLYPWRTVVEAKGLDFALLDLAVQRSGLKVQLSAQPWKRCLAEVEQGKQDGAIGASFRPERTEFAVYPMAGDKPDAERRMRTESYSLFRLRGSGVQWDGRQIRGSDKPIGAQLGYSIVDQLKTTGVAVDEATANAADLFRKMLAGRMDAAALLTQEGDYLLREPAFRARIERLPQPLAEKPYYLVFSKPFHAEHPALAAKFWGALAGARDSAEFRKIEANFD
jgi:polar amino acid transport system substrate-binding protein